MHARIMQHQQQWNSGDCCKPSQKLNGQIIKPMQYAWLHILFLEEEKNGRFSPAMFDVQARAKNLESLNIISV